MYPRLSGSTFEEALVPLLKLAPVKLGVASKLVQLFVRELGSGLAHGGVRSRGQDGPGP